MKYLTYFALTVAISFPSIAWGHSEDFGLDFSQTSVDDMQVEHLRSNASPAGNQLKVDVYLRNFSEFDARKIAKAVQILETVMNSSQFKEQVLNFTFKGEQRFHRNNGMSNQEIYDHLMTGAEDLMPEADQTMNFDLTLYTSWNPWSSVKGYTKPDTMRIWLNTKFYRKSSWSAIDVAANMAHEWTHKMGFGHAYDYNPDRPFSTPYAIGGIVGKVAKNFGY
ncbi:MAG: hypothetical protein WD025_03885 [Bacteriovoracaceae bacterium]